jgi:hypothetical protein
MDPQEASLIAKIIHAARTVSLKTPLWRKRRESAFVPSPDFPPLFYAIFGSRKLLSGWGWRP